MFHTFDLSLETSPPARSKLVSAPVARTFLFFELLDPTSAQESLKRTIQSSRAEHDPPVTHLLNIFHDGVSMTRLLRGSTTPAERAQLVAIDPYGIGRHDV
jgi:hypothetical protein